MSRTLSQVLPAHAVMGVAMAAAMTHHGSSLWCVASGLALLAALPPLVLLLRGAPDRGEHLLDVAAMTALLLVPVLTAPTTAGATGPHVHGTRGGGHGAAMLAGTPGLWLVAVAWGTARATCWLRGARSTKHGQASRPAREACAGWRQLLGVGVTGAGIVLMLLW